VERGGGMELHLRRRFVWIGWCERIERIIEHAYQDKILTIIVQVRGVVFGAV
jgi:hypothetical protein